MIGEVNRSYGDVLGDIFSNDFPTWRLALNVSYPIGNSNADAIAGAHAPREEPERDEPAAARADRRHAGARFGPSARRQRQACRRNPCRARAGRPPARGRREEVRRRHVHQLRGLPGAARPRAGTEPTNCAPCSTTTSRRWTSRPMQIAPIGGVVDLRGRRRRARHCRRRRGRRGYGRHRRGTDAVRTEVGRVRQVRRVRQVGCVGLGCVSWTRT